MNYQKNEEPEYLDDKIIDAEVIDTPRPTYGVSDIEAGLIVALVAKISSLDNQISKFEEAFKEATFKKLSNYFESPSEMIEIFNSIYDNESKDSSNLQDFAHQYYQETDFNYQKRLNLLNYLLLLVYIDDSYENKKELITQMYKTFRVSQSDFENSVEVFENCIKNMSGENLNEMEDKEYKDAVFMSLPDVINDELNEQSLSYIITVLYTLNQQPSKE
jgi:hypothetical protein